MTRNARLVVFTSNPACSVRKGVVERAVVENPEHGAAHQPDAHFVEQQLETAYGRVFLARHRGLTDDTAVAQSPGGKSYRKPTLRRRLPVRMPGVAVTALR